MAASAAGSAAVSDELSDQKIAKFNLLFDFVTNYDLKVPEYEQFVNKCRLCGIVGGTLTDGTVVDPQEFEDEIRRPWVELKKLVPLVEAARNEEADTEDDSGNDRKADSDDDSSEQKYPELATSNPKPKSPPQSSSSELSNQSAGEAWLNRVQSKSPEFVDFVNVVTYYEFFRNIVTYNSGDEAAEDAGVEDADDPSDSRPTAEDHADDAAEDELTLPDYFEEDRYQPLEPEEAITTDSDIAADSTGDFAMLKALPTYQEMKLVVSMRRDQWREQVKAEQERERQAQFELEERRRLIAEEEERRRQLQLEARLAAEKQRSANQASSSAAAARRPAVKKAYDSSDLDWSESSEGKPELVIKHCDENGPKRTRMVPELKAECGNLMTELINNPDAFYFKDPMPLDKWGLSRGPKFEEFVRCFKEGRIYTLKEIAEKLNNGEYDAPAEFAQDVRSIFEGVIKYHWDDLMHYKLKAKARLLMQTFNEDYFFVLQNFDETRKIRQEIIDELHNNSDGTEDSSNSIKGTKKAAQLIFDRMDSSASMSDEDGGPDSDFEPSVSMSYSMAGEGASMLQYPSRGGKSGLQDIHDQENDEMLQFEMEEMKEMMQALESHDLDGTLKKTVEETTEEMRVDMLVSGGIAAMQSRRKMERQLSKQPQGIGDERRLSYGGMAGARLKIPSTSDFEMDDSGSEFEEDVPQSARGKTPILSGAASSGRSSSRLKTMLRTASANSLGVPGGSATPKSVIPIPSSTRSMATPSSSAGGHTQGVSSSSKLASSAGLESTDSAPSTSRRSVVFGTATKYDIGAEYSASSDSDTEDDDEEELPVGLRRMHTVGTGIHAMQQYKGMFPAKRVLGFDPRAHEKPSMRASGMIDHDYESDEEFKRGRVAGRRRGRRFYERSRQERVVRRYMALGAATLIHGRHHHTFQKRKNQVHKELSQKVVSSAVHRPGWRRGDQLTRRKVMRGEIPATPPVDGHSSHDDFIEPRHVRKRSKTGGGSAGLSSVDLISATSSSGLGSALTKDDGLSSTQNDESDELPPVMGFRKRGFSETLAHTRHLSERIIRRPVGRQTMVIGESSRRSPNKRRLSRRQVTRVAAVTEESSSTIPEEPVKTRMRAETDIRKVSARPMDFLSTDGPISLELSASEPVTNDEGAEPTSGEESDEFHTPRKGTDFEFDEKTELEDESTTPAAISTEVDTYLDSALSSDAETPQPGLPGGTVSFEPQMGVHFHEDGVDMDNEDVDQHVGQLSMDEQNDEEHNDDDDDDGLDVLEYDGYRNRIWEAIPEPIVSSKFIRCPSQEAAMTLVNTPGLYDLQQYLKHQFWYTYRSIHIPRERFEQQLKMMAARLPASAAAVGANGERYINVDRILKGATFVTPLMLVPLDKLDQLGPIMATLQTDLRQASGNKAHEMMAHKKCIFTLLNLHGVFTPPSFDNDGDSKETSPRPSKTDAAKDDDGSGYISSEDWRDESSWSSDEDSDSEFWWMLERDHIRRRWDHNPDDDGAGSPGGTGAGSSSSSSPSSAASRSGSGSSDKASEPPETGRSGGGNGQSDATHSSLSFDFLDQDLINCDDFDCEFDIPLLQNLRPMRSKMTTKVGCKSAPLLCVPSPLSYAGSNTPSPICLTPTFELTPVGFETPDLSESCSHRSIQDSLNSSDQRMIHLWKDADPTLLFESEVMLDMDDSEDDKDNEQPKETSEDHKSNEEGKSGDNDQGSLLPGERGENTNEGDGSSDSNQNNNDEEKSNDNSPLDQSGNGNEEGNHDNNDVIELDVNSNNNQRRNNDDQMSLWRLFLMGAIIFGPLMAALITEQITTDKSGYLARLSLRINGYVRDLMFNNYSHAKLAAANGRRKNRVKETPSESSSSPAPPARLESGINGQNPFFSVVSLVDTYLPKVLTDQVTAQHKFEQELRMENEWTLEMKEWKSVSRTQNTCKFPLQFLTQLNVGSLVDARDLERRWYTAVITRRHSARVKVHYTDWSSTWDEWITLNSGRLAPRDCFAVGGRREGGMIGPLTDAVSAAAASSVGSGLGGSASSLLLNRLFDNTDTPSSSQSKGTSTNDRSAKKQSSSLLESISKSDRKVDVAELLGESVNDQIAQESLAMKKDILMQAESTLTFETIFWTSGKSLFENVRMNMDSNDDNNDESSDSSSSSIRNQKTQEAMDDEFARLKELRKQWCIIEGTYFRSEERFDDLPVYVSSNLFLYYKANYQRWFVCRFESDIGRVSSAIGMTDTPILNDVRKWFINLTMDLLDEYLQIKVSDIDDIISPSMITVSGMESLSSISNTYDSTHITKDSEFESSPVVSLLSSRHLHLADGLVRNSLDDLSTLPMIHSVQIDDLISRNVPKRMAVQKKSTLNINRVFTSVPCEHVGYLPMFRWVIRSFDRLQTAALSTNGWRISWLLIPGHCDGIVSNISLIQAFQAAGDLYRMNLIHRIGLENGTVEQVRLLQQYSLDRPTHPGLSLVRGSHSFYQRDPVYDYTHNTGHSASLVYQSYRSDWSDQFRSHNGRLDEIRRWKLGGMSEYELILRWCRNEGIALLLDIDEYDRIPASIFSDRVLMPLAQDIIDDIYAN